MIEAAHDFCGLFDHGALVFPHWHHVCTESSDVGSLRDGVSEESHGDTSFKSAHTDFGLYRWVALQAAHRHQILEVESQLTEFGDLALDKNGHLLGVETASKVVKRDFHHILTHLLRIIRVVGQGLCIGDEDKHLVEVALVLEFYAATERTHVVSDVKTTSGTVAGKHDFGSCHRVVFFSLAAKLQFLSGLTN